MARALKAMFLPVSFGAAQLPVWVPEMPLRATEFTAFPGYAGGLVVKGTVTVGRAQVGTQVLFFDLSGVDMECANPDAHQAVADACGIHIHSGLSCTEAGPNYFSTSMTADPWKKIMYTAVRGKTVGRNVYVTTGLTLAELANRAMVVHDATGARVACARLSMLTETGRSLVPRFSPYPGYTGALAVQGNVEIAQEGVGSRASQSLRFNLTGIDQSCVATTNFAMIPNACGIHIHAGRSCAQVDGHLYDVGNILADPWASIQYVGALGSATGVSTPVVTGAAINGVVGKTLVVYDATGARVACSVILAKNNNTALMNFAGSGPSPRGWVFAALAAVAAASL